MSQVLPDLSKLSKEQLSTLVMQLAANQPKQRAITCKVSEKGALSVYGIGRFPVTLYLSQFEKLAAAWPDILDFVDEHRAEFSKKD